MTEGVERTHGHDAGDGVDWAASIRSRAIDLGFDVVGFANPHLPQAVETRYLAHIAEGRHGKMTWLARDPLRRARPTTLWPEVKTVIVLGMNYGPKSDPLAGLTERQSGTISVYARHRDYHDVIKGRLKQLGQWLHHASGHGIKVFVDTAPVLEKPLAEQAGLGWQGKHTNLVSREMGSWLFLGEIFTDLELAPSSPEKDHCGSCRACLDVCPTNAFPSPYQLDARRCIAYLTIEHHGHIEPEFRHAMGNRIYGCDDCLAVCPWNKFAQATREAKLEAKESFVMPRLAELVELDDRQFRIRFSGSPIKRIGRDRFVRNVLIAIGNSQDKTLADKAIARLDDASSLVRAMAIWAVGQLLDHSDFLQLAKGRASLEDDLDVRSEWEKQKS